MGGSKPAWSETRPPMVISHIYPSLPLFFLLYHIWTIICFSTSLRLSLFRWAFLKFFTSVEPLNSFSGHREPLLSPSGVIRKMPPTLPPIQSVQKIIGLMLLAFSSGDGPGIMKWPSDGNSITTSQGTPATYGGIPRFHRTLVENGCLRVYLKGKKLLENLLNEKSLSD